ncbi:MAG: hypothetical protein ACXWYQ_04755 [Actinomycetota bacterium]
MAKKDASVRFDVGYRSRLTLHLNLPFTNFDLVSATTSAVDAVTWNEGGSSVISIAGAAAAQSRRWPAAPSTPISFKGLKLGIFTMNAT